MPRKNFLQRLVCLTGTMSIFLAVLLTFLPTHSVQAGYGSSTVGIAEREKIRRQQRMREATESIAQGDVQFAEKDYENALSSYKHATDLLPEAPLTTELRSQALQLYAQAAVKLADQRADEGRREEAKKLLEEVLEYNAEDIGAKKQLKQLEDPERYNPALTSEHVADVNKVNQYLRLGRASFDLGNYDDAEDNFHRVLNIDPYNKAARRFLEIVERARRDYHRSAYDHTRQKMLRQVDEAWESQVPLIGLENAGGGQFLPQAQRDGRALNAAKLRDIIIPRVDFDEASINEAVEFLRLKAKQLDQIEQEQSKKGINFVTELGRKASSSSSSSNSDEILGGEEIEEEVSYDDAESTRITLHLENTPLIEVLRYLTQAANLQFRVDPYAVVIYPRGRGGDGSGVLYTKTFSVPPSFLSLEGGSGSSDEEELDPFADGEETKSKIQPLPKAKEVLAAYGVSFPDASSAFYNRSNAQLVVRNTQPNMELVETIVEGFKKDKVEKQILISTRFVEVSQENLDELGFDWLLGPFNIPSSNRVFGSGGTLGNQAASLAPADFPFVSPQGNIVGGTNPLTAGLRSGARAIAGDSIDSLILADELTVNSSLAPGIFGLAGVFTDPQFQVVIHALNQKKGVDLLTAPSVTTRSGKEAKIEIIREFIYPTEFDPPEIPQEFGSFSDNSVVGTAGVTAAATVTSFPVTPTTPTTFETKNVGVTLEVNPTVSPDGYSIEMQLAPEIVEFDGFINYGSPIQSAGTTLTGGIESVVLTENKIEQPVFSIRKVSTNVTVYDGRTVVIGGLMRENVQMVEDKVPFLGDLPLLGRLFQSKVEKHFKSNLMIFVTAKLIDPAGNLINAVQTNNDAFNSGGANTDGVLEASDLIAP